MTNPSHNVRVELDLKNVLLRTRGRNWGYTFVLRPQKPHIDSCYDLHLKVFKAQPAAEAPVNLGGILDGIEKYVFIATAFIDPVRCDDAGRPIAIYIIWFPNVALSSDLTVSVPIDWADQVMSALKEASNKAFVMPTPKNLDDSNGDVEKVFESASDAARQIVIEGAGVNVKIDLLIPTSGKTPSPPPLSSAKRIFVGLLLLFGFYFLLWLLSRRRQ